MAAGRSRSRGKSHATGKAWWLYLDEEDYGEIHSDSSFVRLGFRWPLVVCMVGVVVLALVGLAWGVTSGVRGRDTVLSADASSATDNSSVAQESVGLKRSFNDAYVAVSPALDRLVEGVIGGCLSKGGS